MQSFEDRFLGGIDRTRKHMDPLKPAERMVWDQCRNASQYQMKESDFVEIYGEKEIMRDNRWVEGLKKTEEPKSERGELLESIMIEKAETANWFGEEAFLIPVSDYDDRKAHGDLVFEMQNENGEIVRILLDVTASGSEEKIQKKMKSSLDLLKNERRLSSIKYFQSEITGQKERIVDIPKVTIGITPLTLGELCAELNKNPKKQGNNPIQLYFLDQVQNQLRHLLGSAQELQTVSPEIIQNLEKAEKEITDILNKKESLRTKDFSAKANEDLSYRILSR